jgi:hypothetical protein
MIEALISIGIFLMGVGVGILLREALGALE